MPRLSLEEYEQRLREVRLLALDVDGVLTDGGIIFIDDDHNTVLNEQIIQNIELSSELFEDKDNDDVLDQAEQADPLAQGETLP